MLAAFEPLDLVLRQLERPDDVGERKGVGLAGDLHQQRADDRERHRQLQLKPRALARLGRDANGAAHLLDHVLHDVEADAAAGHVGDGGLHREAGQEQELEQLRLAQRARRVTGGEVARDDGVAQLLEIDAAAIVGHDDLERAGAVARLDPHQALRRLARRLARLRRLDAVIDGVAQQMAERRVELGQNVAVHLRRAADDLELHPPAERAGEIAHHARQALDAVGERPHAAGQRFLVEPMREVDGAPVEHLELGQPLRQELLVLDHAALRLGERRLRRIVGRPLRPARRSTISSVLASSCCSRFSRSSDSANGLTQRDSTSDSPARLSRRFRFSADTRSTRSEARRPREAGPPGPCSAAASSALRRGRRAPSSTAVAAGGVAREDAGERGQPQIDFGLLLVLPLADLRLRRVRDARQQVGGAEQQVDVRLPQRQPSLLRRDETVFHRVGDADADGEADDPRRALERVGRPHAGLELDRPASDRARAPAGRRSAPAPGSRPPRGTGRASRTGSDPVRSFEAPLQRVEQQLVVERADRVSPPRQQRRRVGDRGLRDRRRHVVQFPRVKAMNAVHFVDRTDHANGVAADHEQALVRRAAALVARPRRAVPRRRPGRATHRPAVRRGRSPGRARRRSAGAAASESAAGCATSMTTAVGSASHSDATRKMTTDRVSPSSVARRLGEMRRPIGEVAGRRIGVEQLPRRRRSRPGSCGSARTAAARDTIRRRARRSGSSNRRSPAIERGERRPAVHSCDALRLLFQPARAVAQHLRAGRVALLLHQEGEVDLRVVVIGIEIERLPVVGWRPRRDCRSRRAPGP